MLPSHRLTRSARSLRSSTPRPRHSDRRLTFFRTSSQCKCKNCRAAHSLSRGKIPRFVRFPHRIAIVRTTIRLFVGVRCRTAIERKSSRLQGHIEVQPSIRPILHSIAHTVRFARTRGLGQIAAGCLTTSKSIVSCYLAPQRCSWHPHGQQYDSPQRIHSRMKSTNL